MHWKTPKGTFLIERNRTPLPFVEGGIGLSQGERFQEAAEYDETSATGTVLQTYGEPQPVSLEDELTVSGIHRVIGDALYAFTWTQRYPDEGRLSVELLLQNLQLEEGPLPFERGEVVESAPAAQPPAVIVANLPPDRHFGCSICSQLRPYEQAIQHVQPEESDTDHLPEAFRGLVDVRGLTGRSDLMRCPECGTYYLYETAYEFLIGFGGSYDEQVLTRLSDEEAAVHLKCHT